MTQKKPIPVKYFYYGMLGCALFIGAVFFYFWQKEAKEEKLLAEKGVKGVAWVLKLHTQQSNRRKGQNMVYQHFMDVAFFADTTTAKSLTVDTAVSKAKNGSDLVSKLFNKIHTEQKPMGDYTTITIPISKVAFEKYKVDDKVKIVYVKDNPEIARIAEEL
jgi:hypothetical protein